MCPVRQQRRGAVGPEAHRRQPPRTGRAVRPGASDRKTRDRDPMKRNRQPQPARGGSMARATLVWFAVCLAAATLSLGPPGMSRTLSIALRDACHQPVRGICELTRSVGQWCESWRELRSDTARIRRQLEELRQENERLRRQARGLSLLNAELRSRLSRQRRLGASPVGEVTGTPLLVPQGVRARIIGKELLSTARLLLEVEERRRLPSDAFAIVEGDETVIDQGTQAGVRVQSLALLGSAVVGRVGRVGRWTATLQLISDPEFRTLAQVVRPLPDGAAWGPEGVLQGEGNGRCRLELVDPTAVVQVGDLVCTPRAAADFPTPLCFGRVVAANFDEQSARWRIVVEPAASTTDLREVTILTHVFHPLVRNDSRQLETRP